MPMTLAEMKARLSPEERAEAEKEAARLKANIRDLQSLRIARASTQVELAKRLHVSQASVARLEQRTDVLISTLREYVEALGGHLDLVVSFDDTAEPVRLTGLSEIAKEDPLQTHTTKPKAIGRKHIPDAKSPRSHTKRTLEHA